MNVSMPGEQLASELCRKNRAVERIKTDHATALGSVDQPMAPVLTAGNANKQGAHRGITKVSNPSSEQWEARIMHAGYVTKIGRFGSREAAAQAYDVAAILLRGRETSTNYDQSLYTRSLSGELLAAHNAGLELGDEGRQVVHQDAVDAGVSAYRAATKQAAAGRQAPAVAMDSQASFLRVPSAYESRTETRGDGHPGTAMVSQDSTASGRGRLYDSAGMLGLYSGRPGITGVSITPAPERGAVSQPHRGNSAWMNSPWQMIPGFRPLLPSPAFQSASSLSSMGSISMGNNPTSVGSPSGTSSNSAPPLFSADKPRGTRRLAPHAMNNGIYGQTAAYGPFIGMSTPPLFMDMSGASHAAARATESMQHGGTLATTESPSLSLPGAQYVTMTSTSTSTRPPQHTSHDGGGSGLPGRTEPAEELSKSTQKGRLGRSKRGQPAPARSRQRLPRRSKTPQSQAATETATDHVSSSGPSPMHATPNSNEMAMLYRGMQPVLPQHIGTWTAMSTPAGSRTDADVADLMCASVSTTPFKHPRMLEPADMDALNALAALSSRELLVVGTTSSQPARSTVTVPTLKRKRESPTATPSTTAIKSNTRNLRRSSRTAKAVDLPTTSSAMASGSAVAGSATTSPSLAIVSPTVQVRDAAQTLAGVAQAARPRQLVARSMAGIAHGRLRSKLMMPPDQPYVGVSATTGFDGSLSFVARSVVRGAVKIFGRFPTELEAALAYDKGVLGLAGGSSRVRVPLNFSDEQRQQVEEQLRDAKLAEEAFMLELAPSDFETTDEEDGPDFRYGAASLPAWGVGRADSQHAALVMVQRQAKHAEWQDTEDVTDLHSPKKQQGTPLRTQASRQQGGSRSNRSSPAQHAPTAKRRRGRPRRESAASVPANKLSDGGEESGSGRSCRTRHTATTQGAKPRPMDDGEEEEEVDVASDTQAPVRGSTFRGVSRQSQGSRRWYAHISHNRVRKHLGTYNSPEAAARAYDQVARKLKGRHAILNFPDECRGLSDEEPVVDQDFDISAILKAASTASSGSTGADGTTPARGSGSGHEPTADDEKQDARFRYLGVYDTVGASALPDSKGFSLRPASWFAVVSGSLYGPFDSVTEAARHHDAVQAVVAGPDAPVNFPRPRGQVLLTVDPKAMLTRANTQSKSVAQLADAVVDNPRTTTDRPSSPAAPPPRATQGVHRPRRAAAAGKCYTEYGVSDDLSMGQACPTDTVDDEEGHDGDQLVDAQVGDSGSVGSATASRSGAQRPMGSVSAQTIGNNGMVTTTGTALKLATAAIMKASVPHGSGELPRSSGPVEAVGPNKRKKPRKGKGRGLQRGSNYRGVSRQSQGSRWYAHMSHNATRLHLGTYDTPEEAARVYDRVARKLKGRSAILNFPDDWDTDSEDAADKKPNGRRAVYCICLRAECGEYAQCAGRGRGGCNGWVHPACVDETMDSIRSKGPNFVCSACLKVSEEAADVTGA